MAQITCIVVTPETTALETSAEFVALPLYDGEIGIGENHSPLIGRLGFGELRLRSGNSVTRYYVDGGFVQVSNNVVSVLTSKAVPAEQLDGNSAQLQLEAAIRRAAPTDELRAIRERQLSQARGQLAVVRRNRG